MAGNSYVPTTFGKAVKTVGRYSGRFISNVIKGETKKGVKFTKVYGISKNGAKWSLITFFNKVKTKSGKFVTVGNTVKEVSYSKFYWPKKK